MMGTKLTVYVPDRLVKAIDDERIRRRESNGKIPSRSKVVAEILEKVLGGEVGEAEKR